MTPVLLLPEAEPVTPEEHRSREYKNFRRRLHYRCKKQEIHWDFDNPANVMRYQGDLVAIDFS